MDYTNLLKPLSLELKENSKLKKLPVVSKTVLTILFIPFFVSFFFGKIGFWLTMFFYKMLSAPADHLHRWLKEEREGIHPAAQAVLYFICLPTIFSIQVTLSLNAVSFYIQWFGLQICAYVLSLGGTRWQPFVTDATF